MASPRLWIVSAIVHVTDTQYDGTLVSTSKSVPTFALLSAVQGILTEEHAQKIARDIILSSFTGETADITVTVSPTD